VTETEPTPFAAGREADVYALGGDRVLRRYRTGADTAAEAQVMSYLADHGYPVPRVHAAAGSDLVMDRIGGPTMADALLAGEIGVRPAAVMLACLLLDRAAAVRTDNPTMSAREVALIPAAVARVRRGA